MAVLPALLPDPRTKCDPSKILHITQVLTYNSTVIYVITKTALFV